MTEKSEKLLKALNLISIANDRIFFDENDFVALSAGDELSILAKNTAGIFDLKFHIFSASTLIKGLKLFTEFEFEITEDYIHITDKNSKSKFAIRLAVLDDNDSKEEEQSISETRDMFDSIKNGLGNLNHVKIEMDDAKIKFIHNIASQNKFQHIEFDYTEGDDHVKIKMQNIAKTLNYESTIQIKEGKMKSMNAKFNINYFISGSWEMVLIEDNSFVYFENDDYQYVASLEDE